MYLRGMKNFKPLLVVYPFSPPQVESVADIEILKEKHPEIIERV